LLDHLPRRAWVWALALGVISACGFQPIGLWPLALLAAGGIMLLTAQARSARRAGWLGWLFGIGHFTLGNSWISAAFTYQNEMPAMAGWIAVLGLACYLAIYPALAAFAARLAAGRLAAGTLAAGTLAEGRAPGWAYALIFAGTWIIAEWLRSWVFSGYAANTFAMVLLGPLDRPGLAAMAPVMGTYALSGAAMLLGGALLILARERRWRVACVVAALAAAGMYWPAAPLRNSNLRVTVVQPDLDQERLADPRLYEDNFLRLARLSADLADGSPGSGKRIVLWPESGMVDYLRDGYPQRYYDQTTAFGSPALARRRLGTVVGASSLLLTGAVDLEIGEKDGIRRAVGARNAVTVVAADGRIVGSYFKAHLVPGGEFLPLREYLEPIGLSRLVPGSFDFWPGPGPRTLDLGEFGKAGVQICYEIEFSGQVTDRAHRPDYIFNDFNDGWFGAFGPPQHLAQARMRAVEEGLPVLRSTTTGISAVIDAGGVVRHMLNSHTAGRIDTMVPQALPPTLFARIGNELALFWAVVFLGAGFVALRQGRG